MKRFDRVKQILEESVEGKTINAHGNFWRGLTLEQFKTKKVFGKLLVEVGNAENSNLIKALEGTSPFGADIGTPGAIFNRMPDGFPPVQLEKIAVIKKWINDGCPDDEETPAKDIARHNDYWREFDNWAMFQTTSDTRKAINNFFPVAEDVWMPFAVGTASLGQWQNALAQPEVQQAVAYLGSRIMSTVRSFYGTPPNVSDLLESYELFGADKLPDDPLRPVDPRHNMNGAIMWFFYAAHIDAALRNNPPDAEDWDLLGRAVLIGLLNDGLFRGRFNVKGFTPDEAGAQKIREFVRNLPSEKILDELMVRFKDSRPA